VHCLHLSNASRPSQVPRDDESDKDAVWEGCQFLMRMLQHLNRVLYVFC
jgi:hypothetical protein